MLKGSSKAILHLGFLSHYEIHMDLFIENKELKDYLMKKLKDTSGHEIEKVGIIQFMAQLI